MGARKSRQIVQLEWSDNGNVMASVMNTDGVTSHQENIRQLSAGETCKAAKLAFPSLPPTGNGGNPWFRYSLEERCAAIESKTPPTDWLTREGKAKLAPDDYKPKPEPTPAVTCKACGSSIKVREYDGHPLCERCARDAKLIPEPTPTPTPDEPDVTPDEPSGLLETLITDLARNAAKGAIDENAVRAIIAEETANLRPHVTSVTLGEREPIELEGRQHAMFPALLKWLGTGEHVMLVGPAGTGKSTLAHNAANALGMTFHSISVGPTTTESKLFGFIDAQGNYHTTEFRKAFENGGLFLIDEIDNGNPGVTASLNQALANGSCAFPDGMVKRHAGFLCVGTANTWGTGATAEYVGRNPIDAATLDRFTRVSVDIDADLEQDMALAHSSAHGADVLARIRRYRANVVEHGLKVMLTPRATIRVCKGLEAGLTLEECLAASVFAGVPDEQRRKIEGAR